MTDTTQSTSPEAQAPKPVRIFLVVVDDSPELKVALRYACLRARKSGGKVALLTVLEKGEMQHWLAVENLIREEQRAEAEHQGDSERSHGVVAAAAGEQADAERAGEGEDAEAEQRV